MDPVHPPPPPPPPALPLPPVPRERFVGRKRPRPPPDPPQFDPAVAPDPPQRVVEVVELDDNDGHPDDEDGPAAAVVPAAAVRAEPDEAKGPEPQRRRLAPAPAAAPARGPIEVIDLEALTDSDEDDDVQVVGWAPARDDEVRRQYQLFLDRVLNRPAAAPPLHNVGAAAAHNLFPGPVDMAPMAAPAAAASGPYANPAANYFLSPSASSASASAATSPASPDPAASTSSSSGAGDERPSRVLLLDCGICQEEIQDVATTLCGHVYCWPCLSTAVAAQQRCPTCRKKVTLRQIHRIYL